METDKAVWRLLALFDSQLCSVPVPTLVLAHRTSEANLNANLESRLSILALVSRYKDKGFLTRGPASENVRWLKPKRSYLARRLPNVELAKLEDCTRALGFAQS